MASGDRIAHATINESWWNAMRSQMWSMGLRGLCALLAAAATVDGYIPMVTIVTDGVHIILTIDLMGGTSSP